MKRAALGGQLGGRASSWSRARARWLLLALSCAAAAPGVFSCDSGQLEEGQDATGVVVTVTAHVVPSGAEAELESRAQIGAQIFVTSEAGERQAVSERAELDKHGKFALEQVSLRPWDETYELVIADAAGVYRERAMAVFALTAGTLDYGEIELGLVESGSRTQVRGTVLDASTGLSVAAAAVGLVAEGGQLMGETTTDAAGEFTVENVLAQSYRLEVRAEGVRSDSAPEGYVPDAFEVPLVSSADNNLGTLLLAAKRPANELTLVFIGDKGTTSDGSSSEQCLAKQPNPMHSDVVGIGHLFPIPPQADVNGAYGVQVERWGSEGLTRPDGFGFGTEFWPVFLGLRSGSGGVVVAPVGQSYATVEQDGARFGQELRLNAAGEVLVDARVFDFEAEHVETMALKQSNPLDAPPSDLGYYYRAAGQRHFPVGVGLFSASVRCFESSELKVFQGGAQVARFELSTSTEVRQLGELTEWAPVLIEYGFTEPFTTPIEGETESTEPPAPSAVSDALYFNVLPFAAVDLTRTTTLQAYEQARGVRGYGPELTGFDPAPSALQRGSAASEHALFMGDVGGKAGVWVLDGSTGPMRTESHVAGSSEQLAKGSEVLAVNVAEFSQGSELAVVATRDADGVTVREWIGGRRSFSFDCGTPMTLGYVAGQLLVGSDSGLWLPASCGESAGPGQASAERAAWVANLVQEAPFEERPITLIREAEDARGYTIVLIGTRGDGLWLGDPGADAHWQRVEGIDEDADVVAAAAYDSQLYVLTSLGLFLVDGVSATKVASAGAFALANDAGGAETTEVFELTSLAALNERLYIGTSAGVREYDARQQRACALDPTSTLCGGDALQFSAGVPPVKVNDLVSIAGRLYALTDLGLFELLAAGASLAGAISESESIQGLQAIPIPPPPPMMPPPPVGGASNGPPPPMGGAPNGPPPPVGGGPNGPPPPMGGAPNGPPPPMGGSAPIAAGGAQN